MPALNVNPQFAEAIKTGLKRQAICAKGKYAGKVSDTLYLLAGMRTAGDISPGLVTPLSVRGIAVDMGKRAIHLEQARHDGTRYLAAPFR